MATISLEQQLTSLKAFTQQLMPKNFSIPRQQPDLDAAFKRLREITASLNRETEEQITPKLLATFALILDNIESVAVLIDENCNILHANKIARKRAPKMKIGDKCYIVLGYSSRDNPMCSKLCEAKEVLQSKKPVTYPYLSSLTGIEYNVVAVPLRVNSTSLIMIIASRKEV